FGLPAFLFMMILSGLYARTHTLPSVVSMFNMVIELAPQLSFPHKRKSSFHSHLTGIVIF
ncbi:MAG: hypothetical protein QME90_17510, partial [Thermodesulfobacteriota bacterium]|nr:hypothetical protein [Thermodesulfobacteriota bacterium]